MKVLGIETTCDDTAVAVVSSNKTIHFNRTITQVEEHAKYGGVVPEIASRSHLTHLTSLMDELKRSIPLSSLDAIAVTRGPGLIGGVVVGCAYAKALAYALNKPIVGVDHLEGHALTCRLTSNTQYPYLLLLASGGHTLFIAVLGTNNYQLLGESIDDAIGEAFDKTARLLGLNYPGGPEIERRALLGDPHAFDFPKPLSNSKNCDFSLSGLKTAVRYKVRDLGSLSEPTINDIAASFQRTIGELITLKLRYAVEMYATLTKQAATQLVISGGVASNAYLRSVLTRAAEERGMSFYAPPPSLCVDNAAMIAWAGYERFRENLVDNLDFHVYSRSKLKKVAENENHND